MSITTKVSSKYQVVIPKEVRERLRLHPGQLLQVIPRGGVIHLIPDRPLAELRGFVRGLDVSEIREKEERE